jgi:hypothetical protein
MITLDQIFFHEHPFRRDEFRRNRFVVRALAMIDAAN